MATASAKVGYSHGLWASSRLYKLERVFLETSSISFNSEHVGMRTPKIKSASDVHLHHSVTIPDMTAFYPGMFYAEPFP